MYALPFEKLDFDGRTDSAGKVESEDDAEALAATNICQRTVERTIG